MTWQRVNPSYLYQDNPETTRACWWEVGSQESGSLLLWLDSASQVAGFQLTHSVGLPPVEYLVQWHRGRGVRVGVVDAGEAVVERGPRYKMAPVVRSSSQPAAVVLARLLDYFQRNASVLESSQRERVTAVLISASTGDRP